MDYIKLQLIKEIKGEIITKRGKRKLRKKLLKRMRAETEEVGDYVLKIGYVNRDRKRPYVQIFTKESYESYNQFRNKNNFNEIETNDKKMELASQELEQKYWLD